jgi:FkbM family methyltransferase
LKLVDGVRVVVPDSLDLITPYVLREQEDWFEDELRFLRRILQAGEAVIDIGANYGVYTLSMARAVGPTGSVLAFEPASATASMLEASVAANGYSHVTVRRSAVSAVAGTGQLTVGEHSELNALARDTPAGAVESVPLVTLDDCLREYGWTQVDFVKIDAEGEERNILQGGERFFSQLSPLVEYEIKAGTELHLDLVEAFTQRGYSSYRLVPGLDLLVPFDAASPPDDYLLNLFCCKSDQASRLAERGKLLASKEVVEPRPADWRVAMAGFPYAKLLRERWERTMARDGSRELDEALSLYWRGRDPSSSAAERFAALSASLSRLQSLSKGEATGLRRVSLARAARDFGARALAADTLAQLSEQLLSGSQANPAEPFLTPSERFDAVPPGNAPGRWLLASVLEEYERLSAFSSFYTDASALPRLHAIRDLGFASAEMQRRLAMVQLRARGK